MQVEGEIRSQNMFAEKARLFQFLDGMTKSGHRERVFCTDINVSVLRSNCISGDNHTFQKLIGITFHDGAVHESARVALVAVTYHIAFLFRLGRYLFPFPSCRESAAASSAQTGFVYFFHHIFRLHVKKRFFKRLESAGSQIFA